MFRYLKFTFLLICILMLVSPASAAGGKGKCRKTKERAATGVVASSGTYGSNAEIPSDTGAAPGDEPSVIRASITRNPNGKCEAVITNSSECHSYSVSYAVQVSTLKTSKYSQKFSGTASLKPGGQTSRGFSCDREDQLRINVKKAIRK